MELHYLDMRGADSIIGMPIGICKLTNLQKLSNFVLGIGDGYLVRELKNLSNLSGDFCLSGLENIKGQDTRKVMLKEKSRIDRLTLKWSADFDYDIRNKEEEEQVLDLLRPQKKLEQLIIENFGGAQFSTWIADSSFKNLLSLKLRNCKNCKSLPSIGRLPLLKDLGISDLNEVNGVGVEFFGENQPNTFVSLETLCFERLPNWEKWDPCEGDEQVSKFPCLRKLYIQNCPKLVGRLPTRIHSLQKLEVYCCYQLVVSISSFPSLSELSIRGCEELVDTCSVVATSLQKVYLSNISKFKIPPERVMSRFTNLECITIDGWKEMASLSQNGFGLLGHRSITIAKCAQLVSLETVEVDEEKLQVGKIFGFESLLIRDCERLNKLPKVLHALQYITSMEITGCTNLVSFAENNLPQASKRLFVYNCKNLKYLEDESGKKSNKCFPEDLKIHWCPSLICLSSRGDLANGLRRLEIHDCLNLTSLFSNAKLPMTLKRLQISYCPELESIAQDFHDTTGLESIKILRCQKIKYLPWGLDKLNHLLEIEIASCSSLVPFEESVLPPSTNLRILSISFCEKFGAFPKCINNFVCLQKLKVWGCSIDISFPEEGFPTNLTSLEITNAPKICRSLVEWGLDRLTSLQTLDISGEGCSDVVSFPKKEMMLSASLTGISIQNFEDLEYMYSEGFQNLTSLQTLLIKSCPKLTSLPDKDTLLSLGMLLISNCPKLEIDWRRGKGREWSKIAHMPFVELDYKIIIPRRLN